MSSAKKSFVLYFDNYRGIRPLSYQQKGMLLSALFEYAMAAAERSAAPEELLEQFPEMDEITRVAYGFVADTIYRDTEKWHEKHERYSQAAKNRCEKERSVREQIEELRRGAYPELR